MKNSTPTSSALTPSAPAHPVAASRALWLESPGHAALRDEVVAVASSDEVTVRALFSAISRGTESLVFTGAVPASEYQRMRAPFQHGEFPAPVKYGYASVGEIEAAVGAQRRRVFCLYPHQSRYVVPASAVHDLPDDVPPSRAVLAANMETAVNALWDAPVSVGDHVAVIGAGVVGCLVGYLAARVPGTRVQLIDIEPSRASVARALGCEFALPAAALSRADRVFHASTSPEGLGLALSLSRFEGEVIELSWYGDRQPPVPLGASFHSQRLSIRASQVGSIAPAKRASRDYASRLALALSLLADPALDALFSEEVSFESLPSRLPALLGPGSTALAVRVRY